jgi:AcrR family transcriptional regulator
VTGESAANGHDGGLVWSRPEPGTRSSRLSRDQIAAAALAIADADGFEAVSMRRIAATLDAGTMSLYRYVATKAELLAVIDDALIAEAIVPGPMPADWRAAITAIARQTRQAYLRHPWAVHALQGKSAAAAALGGPNALRHFEQSLAALAPAPLSTTAKLDLLALIDDFIAGHLLHAAELAERQRDVSPADAEATEAYIRAQLAGGELPRLAALADDPAARSLGDAGQADARFERGLRFLIDGMAAGGS